MKKKIIFGLHNPYLIFDTYKEIKKISRYADIFLITTNHLLSKNDKKRIEEWKKKRLIKDVIIFERYFYKSGNLNILRIILNYIWIFSKLKKLSKIKIDLCILGSNTFIWERIISETIIKKKCKVLIYQPDMLTLPIKSIKELYNSVPINKIIKKIHKSRQLKNQKGKTKNISFWKKNMNYLNYRIDIFERKYIGPLFFNKNFLYRPLDLNTAMDSANPRMSIILTYFKTLQIYWKKLYPEVKVELIKHSNNCSCRSNLLKSDLLFLGDDSDYGDEIKKKISKNLKRDLLSVLSNLKDIKEIHFRPHPGSKNKNNEKMLFNLNKSFSNKVKIKYSDSLKPLEDIACNYKIVLGSFGTGLFTCEQSCKKIISIGLSSISQYYYDQDRKDCKLKVKGTNIGVIENNGNFKKNIFLKKKNKQKLETFSSKIKKLLIN
jgi:hypothetical protein